MSYKVTALVLSKITGSPVRKVILLAMADVANHDGSDVWISNTTIAAQSEVKRETVSRNIRALKSDNLIKKTGKKRCQTGYTIIYKMMVENIKKLPESMPDLRCEFKSQHDNQGVTLNVSRCDSDTPQGVTQDHTNHPEPSLNHILDKFLDEYPENDYTKRDQVEGLFAKLSDDERQQAISAACAYAKAVAHTPGKFTLSAQRFLRESIFKQEKYQTAQSKPDASFDIPAEGTPLRKLYTEICLYHPPTAWVLWFHEGKVRFEGNQVIALTKYAYGTILERYSDQITNAGFVLTEWEA